MKIQKVIEDKCTRDNFVITICLTGDDKDDEPGNGRKKHRGPCEPLHNPEHMQVEVVKPPKNQNESFGHGMVLKITCENGYNSNIQTANSTVRCNKGVWKPVKPYCSLSK